MNIYQEELMEYYKNPPNRGSLENPNFVTEDYNPSCGDRIKFEAIIKNNVFEKIVFSGSGCVLSQAAASMLAEYCLAKSLNEIMALDKSYILKRVGLELGPNRVKCVLLSFTALKEGIKKVQQC